MREFIYLSPEKLNAFMSAAAPRRFPRIMNVGGGVTPGPQGNIAVTVGELDDQEKVRAKLRAVIKDISKISRSYEDDNIRRGDWVSFAGEFGYSILDSGHFRLFIVTQTAATLNGNTALLLYGKPGNVLLGSPPLRVDIRELDSYPRSLISFAQDLVEVDAANISRHGLGADRAAAELFFRIAAKHDGADRVAGLAKVREVIVGDVVYMVPDRGKEFDPEVEYPRPERIVIASPLYIESIP
jgi:hypothetical protein